MLKTCESLDAQNKQLKVNTRVIATKPRIFPKFLTNKRLTDPEMNNTKKFHNLY